MSPNPDDTLDLHFSRLIPVPRVEVWRAWTEPARLMPWFCPRPWQTSDCTIDLRPGGRFYTLMQSPEGQTFPNEGCYLEVVPLERLVWTNALLAGYRPAPLAQSDGASDGNAFAFSACIALADAAGGTRYSATVWHADARGRQRHAEMGFEQGWSAALDQMVAMIRA